MHSGGVLLLFTVHNLEKACYHKLVYFFCINLTHFVFKTFSGILTLPMPSSFSSTCLILLLILSDGTVCLQFLHLFLFFGVLPFVHYLCFNTYPPHHCKMMSFQTVHHACRAEVLSFVQLHIPVVTL